MLNVRLAGDHLYGKSLFFDGVLFCAVLFSHEMSWIRSGTELGQYLRFYRLLFSNALR